MRFIYIAVEGHHDIEFVGRILSEKGLGRIQLREKLDDYWEPLIPKTFPVDGDLLKRVPVPIFFQNTSMSVAIQSAIGDSRLVKMVKETCAVLQEQPTSIGILLDSDDMAPGDRFNAITSGLSDLQLPQRPGEVAKGKPQVGLFVLPDNLRKGTLEDILIESANVVYPGLHGLAAAYVDSVGADDVPDGDRNDFDAPSGKKKALVGSIASILRPGKAIQVSIQDNSWIKGEALKLPSVNAVIQFVDDLLAEPSNA